MSEKLVIIPKRTTTLKKALNFVWFLLTCLMLLLSTFVTPIFFAIPAILFGILWYYQTYRTDIEFEYTYFDGDLRMARIKDKRRRKLMGWLNFDENVIMIAPKGDRSVYKYENDKNLTYKNLSSGVPGAKVYELIAKGEKGIIRYEFEPDEDMLDAMRIKYPRLVIK